MVKIMNKKHILPLVVSALFCLGMTTAVAKEAFPKLNAKDFEIENTPVAAVEKQITLSFPGNGQTIDILKPNVVKFVNAMHTQAQPIENDYILHEFYARADSDGANYGKEYSNDTDKINVSDYAKTNMESRSKEVSLIFDYDGFDEDSEFTVKVGLKADLSDAKVIKSKTKYLKIHNLFSGKTYYWQVSQGDVASPIQSFKTSEGFRMVTANGIQNVRDMGGRPVHGGKHIKQGLIFRGGELVPETYDDASSGSTHHANLTEDNKAVLRDELGIKYEIDFRGDDEANNITKSPLNETGYEDIDYMRIPNLAAYDYFFEKSKSKTEFWGQVKDMFLAFKNANEKHVYFHCWGGADRTGTIGFMLGALLGMSMTDLVTDYELTSFAGNYRPHRINDAKKVYRWPSFMYELYEGNHCANARGDNPDKLLKDVIADFLIEYAGLTQQDIDDIRANLLED